MPGERKSEYALCIFGAGIAGLNALAGSLCGLGENERVLVVDRRAAAGGMWHDAYDFVRLHQPHPFFTAGNIPWTIDAPPEHLATRDEVVAHLQHCAAVLGKDPRVEWAYSHEVVDHEERADDVVVTLRGPDGEERQVHARSVIKAFGYDVQPTEPLSFSSTAVRSTIPHDRQLFGDAPVDDAPVVLVGGGKTAMDSALRLIAQNPKRHITMVLGRGTLFSRRERSFPTGLSRFVGGQTQLAAVLPVIEAFDGTNEREIVAAHRERLFHSLVPDAPHHVFGILGPEELATVQKGVDELIKGHVDDVGDGDEGPSMRLRSGDVRPVDEGTWFVNCTGTIVVAQRDRDPYLSPGGRVVTVNAHSAIHFLTTYAAFLLAKLHARGLLRDLPLYELDVAALRRVAPEVWWCAEYSHVVHNMLLILDVLPQSDVLEMGVNLDNWFPLHRRLWDAVRLTMKKRALREHTRNTLETIRKRFDVRCAPLPHTVAATRA